MTLRSVGIGELFKTVHRWPRAALCHEARRRGSLMSAELDVLSLIPVVAGTCVRPALRQYLVGAVGGSLAAALAPAAGWQARSPGGQARAWLAAQGACWPGE